MSALTCDTVGGEGISQLAYEVFGKPAASVEKMSGDFVCDIYKIKFSDKNLLLNISNQKKKLMSLEKDNIASRVKSLDCINQRELTAFPKVVLKSLNKNFLNKQYYVTEYLPGVPFSKIRNSLTPIKINEIYSEMGIYSNRVAQNEGAFFGSITDKNKQFFSWSQAFLFLLDEVLSDAEKSETYLPYDAERIKERFSEHSRLLNEVKTPSLIDLELYRDHFLIDRESKSVAGIVDCQCPVFGDSLMQPVITLLYDNINYIDCYNYGNFLTEDEKARMALYLIFFEIYNSVKVKLGNKKRPQRRLFTESIENYNLIFQKEF